MVSCAMVRSLNTYCLPTDSEGALPRQSPEDDRPWYTWQMVWLRERDLQWCKARKRWVRIKWKTANMDGRKMNKMTNGSKTVVPLVLQGSNFEAWLVLETLMIFCYIIWHYQRQWSTRSTLESLRFVEHVCDLLASFGKWQPKFDFDWSLLAVCHLCLKIIDLQWSHFIDSTMASWGAVPLDKPQAVDGMWLFDELLGRWSSRHNRTSIHIVFTNVWYDKPLLKVAISIDQPVHK